MVIMAFITIVRLLAAMPFLALLALFTIASNESLLSPSVFDMRGSRCCNFSKITSSDVAVNKALAVEPSLIATPLNALQTNEAPEVRPKAVAQPRTAICLVGGARAFELTGESIRKHLLDSHKDWDVFLHAPLDQEAHKFTLLQNVSNLVSARIFVPETLQELELHRNVLFAGTSPNGIQGLLQYFKLVEGCLDMITAHETAQKFRYDFVVRTRVDGFWSGPLPPLRSLNASTYYVPIGSAFGGFNDRLGVGSRNNTIAALSRLSLLPFLHSRGNRHLNSESAFKAQMMELAVPCESIAFPFCILSRRKYFWPMDPSSVPVASIATRGYLNGAKCRPCTPVATGSQAQSAAAKLNHSWGWPGKVRDLQLCDARGDWELGWEDVFARVAGRIFDTRRVQTRSSEECEADVENFRRQWDAWDAPSAKEICSRRRSSWNATS